MAQDLDDGLVLEIGPDVSAVASLRRSVAALVPDDLADVGMVAELLVSELITNVLLHAEGAGQVRARMLGPTLRVEVHDDSPVVPARRSFAVDALTGRGLGLVDDLADSWGVVRTERGKFIWFEVGPRSEVVPTHGPEPERDAHQVLFIDLPVDLLQATIEYGDAVLREMSWLALGGDLDVAVPEAQPTPAVDLGAVLTALEAAALDGVGALQLEAWFTPDEAGAAMARLALADEADRLAAEGQLLSQPAVPEISACRNWFLSEIARQVNGEQPRPWVLAIDDRPAPSTDVGPDERAALDLDGAIRADHTNHILYVDPAVAELLGWEPQDLTGRRLSEVIPQRLREAHLAGFTRYQLLGKSRILGRPIDLPALHRLGHEVEVQVLIEAVTRPDGRRAYRAHITALGG